MRGLSNKDCEDIKDYLVNKLRIYESILSTKSGVDNELLFSIVKNYEKYIESESIDILYNLAYEVGFRLKNEGE